MAGPLGTAKLCLCQGSGTLCKGLQGPTRVRADGQMSVRRVRAAALLCPGLHRKETGANPMEWDEINQAAELF